VSVGWRLTHPSTPFPSQLRTRPGAPIRIAAGGQQPSWTLRVEMPEVWDTVRVEAPPSAHVSEIKRRALEALYPGDPVPGEFVMKHDGWLIRDEERSVAETGAGDGSIFLLTFARRRPIRD
jgi:hypothetical protein